MSVSGLLVFAGVYFVAVATPGPGVAAIVARALARGMDGTPAFIAGFACGDLLLFLLSAAGLSVVAQNFAGLFTFVRLVGAAYLLFMAWKIWSAPVEAIAVNATARPEAPFKLFLSSFTLTIGNPKPIIFFLSIMPLVVDMAHLNFSAIVLMSLVIVVVLVAVLAGYSFAAAAARNVFSSEVALRRINKGTATILAGAALAIAKA